MRAHIIKFRDKKSGILDVRLYDYKDTLNFKPLTKKESLDLHDIKMHHAMTFCGVHLKVFIYRAIRIIKTRYY